MAFNNREEQFVYDLQILAKEFVTLYGKAFRLKESFAEEFKTGQENALSDHTTDLAVLGIDYADVQAFCEQVCINYDNFWLGSAVGTREYGKDARRVAFGGKIVNF